MYVQDFYLFFFFSVELTFISDEIKEQVGVVNGGIADVSTFFCPPAHALLTEAPPTVRPILV